MVAFQSFIDQTNELISLMRRIESAYISYSCTKLLIHLYCGVSIGDLGGLSKRGTRLPLTGRCPICLHGSSEAPCDGEVFTRQITWM